MNILIVGGLDMKVGDGSAYWMLKTALEATGHQVQLAECTESGSAENKVTLAVLMRADAIVCYSYGCASVKEIWHDNAKTWPAGKRYKRWVIVAGVPDAWMDQFYGSLWHKPGFVDIGTNFQVNAIPASCELQDVAYVTFNQMTLQNVIERDYVIDCNSIESDLDPVSKHTHLQNNPDVLATIGQIFGAAA